jgi:hypothetical protein
MNDLQRWKDFLAMFGICGSFEETSYWNVLRLDSGVVIQFDKNNKFLEIHGEEW